MHFCYSSLFQLPEISTWLGYDNWQEHELIIMPTNTRTLSHSLCLSLGSSHISIWNRSIQQIFIHKDSRVPWVFKHKHTALHSDPSISAYLCMKVWICMCSNPAAPGLVTNLTAYAHNHTFVVLTWFLPHRINGLITKFAVKVRLVRTGQIVRYLEVNAEDIMTGALPHCNVLYFFLCPISKLRCCCEVFSLCSLLLSCQDDR